MITHSRNSNETQPLNNGAKQDALNMAYLSSIFSVGRLRLLLIILTIMNIGLLGGQTGSGMLTS